MKYSIGQKLFARWETVNHTGEPLELKIPVRVTTIGDGIVTVVEDREENAVDFNMDGVWITSQGEKVTLVERK